MRQFHVGVCKEGMPPQAIAGSLGIHVPLLKALWERLHQGAAAAAAGMFPHTQFAVLRDMPGSLTLSCL
jgi:hypothetical protein